MGAYFPHRSRRAGGRSAGLPVCAGDVLLIGGGRADADDRNGAPLHNGVGLLIIGLADNGFAQLGIADQHGRIQRLRQGGELSRKPVEDAVDLQIILSPALAAHELRYRKAGPLHLRHVIHQPGHAAAGNAADDISPLDDGLEILSGHNAQIPIQLVRPEAVRQPNGLQTVFFLQRRFAREILLRAPVDRDANDAPLNALRQDPVHPLARDPQPLRDLVLRPAGFVVVIGDPGIFVFLFRRQGMQIHGRYHPFLIPPFYMAPGFFQSLF